MRTSVLSSFIHSSPSGFSMVLIKLHAMGGKRKTSGPGVAKARVSVCTGQTLAQSTVINPHQNRKGKYWKGPDSSQKQEETGRGSILKRRKSRGAKRPCLWCFS